MPRRVDRKKRHKEAVDGLFAVIAESGMEAVSVRSVIAKTSWSRGLIDRHFRNFAELIEIGLRTFCEQGEGRALQARKGRRGRAALRATFLEFLPLDERRRREGRIWLGFLFRATSDAALAEQMLACRSQHAAHYEQILAEMIAAGEASASLDVDEAVESLLGFELAAGVQAMLVGAADEALLKRRAQMLLDQLGGGEPAGESA